MQRDASGRIRLVATGGTISSIATPHGHVAAKSGLDLLRQAYDDPARIAHVDVEDLVTKTSFALTPADMFSVAARVRVATAEGAGGVVVTHGTDAMEETAFAVDLVHDAPVPVVFTGAQRPFDHEDPDGPRNLRDALACAGSPALAGAGTLLTFAGSAWPARGVRKMWTLDLHGFAVPGAQPIARVEDDGVVTTGAHPRRAPLPGLAALVASDGPSWPRVDVVATFPGSDGTGLRAARASGARGIVLQALGAGNAAPADTAVVRDLVAEGCPVMVTSRIVQGPVAPIYGGGGGADLAAAGAIFPDDVTTAQGRILLTAALALAQRDTSLTPAAVVGNWVDLTR